MRRYWKAKTPTVIQMEAVECGAASLASILAYYGKYVPLEQLRLDCGVSRDGSSALKIIQAAQNYGLEAGGYKKDLEELYEIQAPCILFWQFKHFLVLEGFSKNKVFLNDPATGPRTITYEELDQGYTGVMLAFTPSKDFKRGAKPPLFIKEIFQRVESSISSLLYLLAISLLLILPGLAFPVFTRIFVDDFLIKPNFAWELNFILAILFTTAVAGILTGLRQYCLNKFDIKLSVTFSSTFLWHLLRLPVAFYTQRYSGEIAYRMNFNDSIAQTLTGPLAATFLDLFLTIFYAIIIFLYDVQIGFMAVAALLLNIGLMIWIQRTRTDAYARFRQEQGALASTAVGAIQQIETIKASGIESSVFARLAGHIARNGNGLQMIGKKDALLLNAPLLFQTLVIAGLLTLGGWRVVTQDVTIGMLMALYLLLIAFLQPVSRFVNFSQIIQNMSIHLSRLNDVMRNPVDFRYQKQKLEPTAKTKLEGFLTFQDVTFGYIPSDPPLIEGLSFSLTPGKRIALVGPSGSGKSTVAKLACALYRPWQGLIHYDKLPFEDIEFELFHNSVACIDQDILLFEGTVWDNLTLWDTTITEEMVIAATKDAAIHDTILSRHDLGYKAPLIEGGRNLSGGQRQLLEIARALVKRPSILIMDEATSALDSETEKTISDNIRRRGCTCLMIAHRLSTIQDCDEIIVLEQGKVVNRGTHTALKEQPGLYQELIQREEARQ